MISRTDLLARQITRSNSLLTYWIIRLLVDKTMINDCFKSYAYLRWVDDLVDEYIKSSRQRKQFIQTQQKLVNLLYSGKNVTKLKVQERLLAEVIKADDRTNPGLESFLRNFLAIIEFDVFRRGKRIKSRQLKWYSQTLGKAVTDGIEYFIGHSQHYPNSVYKYKAATAAHIVHTLRDYDEDRVNGYFNISSSKQFQAKVALAKKYFKQGRLYIEKLPNWRCKLAAYLYCFRFERILKKYE